MGEQKRPSPCCTPRGRESEVGWGGGGWGLGEKENKSICFQVREGHIYCRVLTGFQCLGPSSELGTPCLSTGVCLG